MGQNETSPATQDDPVLIALRADLTAKKSEARTILADPGATEERIKRAESLPAEIAGVQVKIDARLDALRSLTSLKGSVSESDRWESEPDPLPPFVGGTKTADIQAKGHGRTLRIDHVSSPEERKMLTGGFHSLGHFAWCVAKAGRDGRAGVEHAVKHLNEWDQLQSKMVPFMMERKAPSGMFELSDPDGGLLVPPQFSNQIYQRMVDTNELLARLSPIPATSNVIKLRAVKEDSRADGSRGGGVLGYWENEADQYIRSKTQFRPVELNLHKLTVFTFITEELLADSDVAIDTFIGNLAAKEINFKLNDGIVNGTGAGMPKGILTSGSLITATAVTGQGAGTFVFQNVLKMYSRVVAGQRGSLVWLYNQDVEPQLYGMYLPTGTAAGVIIFTPNQAGTGFTLMGRPALVIEQAQSVGTAGDVIAFATDGYICATKGGIQSFMSMHLRFDYDEFAYKWRFRFDGQMWDAAPLTPFKGTNTVSSVVVLSSTRT